MRHLKDFQTATGSLKMVRQKSNLLKGRPPKNYSPRGDESSKDNWAGHRIRRHYFSRYWNGNFYL